MLNRPFASRTGLYLGLWLLALVLGTLALNLRHRDFAWYYHPDEPGKVEQILTGEWNYHHPMLLLTSAKVLVDVCNIPREPQAIVEAGRAISALFSALAVGALSLLAFQWRGWPAALAAGAALMLHHQVFELSHYMKEDTALLFGLSIAWLALFHFERRRTVLGAAALGVGCALAISGKYLGVVVLIGAIPALIRAGGAARWGAFLGALVLALALINFPLLTNLDRFQASLARETGFVVKGQKELTRSVPHAEYWNVFVDNTTPAIWILLAICLAARWRERRALSPARWHVLLFPFVYALLLSFSPKSNDRYFLPASAALTFLAGLGVVDIARRFDRQVPARWIYWGAGLLLVGGQVPSWRRYEVAFQNDDSKALIEYCRTKLPPTAVLAKDSRIWLPDRNKPNTVPADAIPQKVIAAKFVADLGNFDELRAKGITHVAVSESDYGRFFRKSLQPKKGEEAAYERRKTFYETLLREGDLLLFERDRGTVIYLHPGIRLYELPPSI